MKYTLRLMQGQNGHQTMKRRLKPLVTCNERQRSWRSRISLTVAKLRALLEDVEDGYLDKWAEDLAAKRPGKLNRLKEKDDRAAAMKGARRMGHSQHASTVSPCAMGGTGPGSECQNVHEGMVCPSSAAGL